jgi:2-dehydro-3-deoxyphosphooctonate aldolase (KDO 8-P synthase)
MKTEIFIGPCVLESEELAMTVAASLKETIKPFEDQIDFYFKGSFDKANRSSIDSYRGPGIEEGLRILEKIKNEFGFKLITDYHFPDQADQVASVVDVLQVPAFLCRQTDMIVAGATAAKKHDCLLKIKKGQFLAPEDTKNLVDKAATIMSKEAIRLTERGTSFGYNNLVVDMASFEIMKSFGVKTVHDCTHSVQRPGGLGKTTGGKREQIFTLTRAAAAAGADGFFMEAHPDPTNALSDATSQLPLDQIGSLIETILKIKKAIK